MAGSRLDFGRVRFDCCRLEKRVKKSVSEVASRIVPSEQVDREKIEKLREFADGRYLDAARPGIYHHTAVTDITAEQVGGRRIRTKES